MSFLENLKLDEWWKAVFYLGVAGIASSFLFDPEFLQQKHMFGFGLGWVLVGISFWIAEKEYSAIKPPNAYTGPAAVLTRKVIEHNPVTVIILVAGLGLIGFFGFLIVKALI
jgi:hypothetical protein